MGSKWEVKNKVSFTIIIKIDFPQKLLMYYKIEYVSGIEFKQQFWQLKIVKT